MDTLLRGSRGRIQPVQQQRQGQSLAAFCRSLFTPRAGIALLVTGVLVAALLSQMLDPLFFRPSSSALKPAEVGSHQPPGAVKPENVRPIAAGDPAASSDSGQDEEEGPDLSRPSKCPPGCRERGTCNEETGECHCLPSFAGADCSEPALPACNMLPGYTSTCAFLTTCECAIDCQKLRLPIDPVCLRGTLPDGTANPNLTAVFEGPRYHVRWNDNQTEILPPTYDTPADSNPSPLTTPENCPDTCHGRGQCFRQFHTCQCPWVANGQSCNENIRISHLAGSSPACFNDCSGKGECVFGVCKCQQGYFGMDCSLFIGKSGKTRILTRKPYSWSDVGPAAREVRARLRPRVYVYDIPGYFNTWQGLHSAQLDWEEPVWFLERLLNSPYRTPDPAEADFFYIPLFIRNRDSNKANIIAFALKYIRERWPYHARTEGRDHIVITNSDWGNCQLGGPGGFKSMSHVLDDVMTLTLWGMTKNMTHGTERGCFRPGLDVAIPPIMGASVYELAPKFPSEELSQPQKRDILLYFRGSYYTEEKPIPGEYRMSFGARQAMWEAYHGKFQDTGVLLEQMKDPIPVTSGGHWYLKQMAKSLFCFAPAGWGWAMRTTQAVILGCIPLVIQPDVVQPFESDGLDWSEFSVKLSLEEIPQTEKILRAIPPERVLEMQKAMYRVRKRFVWSSTNLNPFVRFPKEEQEKGARSLADADTFVAVMVALAKRLKA